MAKKKNHINTVDWFVVVCYIFAINGFIVTLLPFMNVISVSISDERAVYANEVYLLPKGFSLAGYKQVLKQSGLWVYYGNTVYYTLVGTIVNIIATCIGAYPLSRADLPGRRVFNFLIAFTMYFSGGMIPTYLLLTTLGFYNSRWVMIIPGAISTYDLMVCRSAYSGIPGEVLESAEIDGANDWQIFSKIATKLIKPTLAVLVLYYAVGHWNDFMTALLYFSDQNLMPLQVLLRRVLIQNTNEMMNGANSDSSTQAAATLQVRYVTIVVATAPIILIYPFVQKYFVKGVMLGAVKG